MGMTVNSLGPAGFGLGCQKPKAKAGPTKVSPHPPMSRGNWDSGWPMAGRSGSHRLQDPVESAHALDHPGLLLRHKQDHGVSGQS